MGNKELSRGDDFNKMIAEMRKDKSRRVNINPEKKYLALMKQSLESSKLPETLKALIFVTLSEKVSEVELIETVTCINALRNNEFEASIARSTSSAKDKPESKYVKVNFELNFFKKILRNFQEPSPQQLDAITQSNTKPGPRTDRSKSSKSSHSCSKSQDIEVQRKQRLKTISQVMKKQLNRMIHPFGKLNKAFAEYIEANSQDFAPKTKKQEIYEKAVQKLILQWCSYLENTCMAPYKKWIMAYTQLQEAKYAGWIRNLLLQEIWAVNNGYLFLMLTTVIQRCKNPIEVDIKELQESAALLTPSLFSIDPKLQIQGHFFDSIYEMSEVCGKYRPQQILTQLQTVKKRVCTDIDNYHRLVQLGQVYQIDSDNILGIVAYILCKIASKIDQIHTHLIFLRILYGEKVYYSLGLGSYMFSTIFGAIQFLQSAHFSQLINQKKNKQKQPQIKYDNQKMGSSEAKGQSETKWETSALGEGSSVRQVCSQADRRQIQVSSMLQHI